MAQEYQNVALDNHETLKNAFKTFFIKIYIDKSCTYSANRLVCY